jgi:hypothetical protein
LPISRSDIGSAGTNFVSVSGFFYFDPANAIEPLCESCRETLRHVLYRDNSGTILGHLFENLEQGFRASGGRTNGNNRFPLLRGRRQEYSRNRKIAGAMFRGTITEPAKLAHAGRRRRPDRVFQQNRGFFQEAADSDLRFGNDINRTDFQGADSRFGSGASQSGTNHDGHWILRHELLQKSHAIHPRHFQIQQNDIWRELLHFIHGNERVGSDSDTESTLLRKYRHKDLTYDGRIIHHKNI